MQHCSDHVLMHYKDPNELPKVDGCISVNQLQPWDITKLQKFCEQLCDVSNVKKLDPSLRSSKLGDREHLEDAFPSWRPLFQHSWAEKPVLNQGGKDDPEQFVKFLAAIEL